MASRAVESDPRHPLAVATGSALYGGITVGGRYFAQQGLSLLEISLIGVSFGALTLAPLMLLRPRLRPRLEDSGLWIAFGLSGAGLQLSQFGGIVLGVPVAVVALLLYTQPVWTVLLGRSLLREKISRRKLAAVSLALVGIVILLDPLELASRSFPLVGLAAGLAGGLFLSLWVILGRISGLRGNAPWTTSFGYAFSSATVLLLLTPLVQTISVEPELARLAPEVWVVHWRAVAVYTLVAHIASNLLVMWGMREIEASSVGILLLLEPISAACLAAWMFGEPLTARILVAGLLVLASNLLLVGGRRSLGPSHRARPSPATRSRQGGSVNRPERRSHVRDRSAIPIILEVELHGYDRGDTRFRSRGRTVNVSRGGLLARVDEKVSEGTRCLTHFPSATGQLGRTMIYGTVQRSRTRNGSFEVAVAFDNPLHDLDLPSDEPETED